ncbi:YbhB/YbcL family Raf kinase inhibitor-like protein [Herbiconiux moechotypicola]|uniref:YbhB/YbcL family Raf kinase inhibitor-like protein n=1 Tax=Herbiconiux moechotypicola TaxID=637393 RepID=A0ABN3E5D3_9MICO|nr:YbhB/YbcL family Raf kinase inhibitor-like protein [Herbiconiux moechotypicola]MCS5731784.1 YbhB/YbcL family Raf kinase inhibitor-like protein [Herbiconiux moechotypicola]
MTGNDPFARAAEVPTFTLTSTTVVDGGTWPAPQYSAAFGVPGGEDVSPQLSWSGAPEGTQSYLVTVYDPDAPTQSGFWHWAVANIPAAVTELPENASVEGLPAGAVQFPNDADAPRFYGAAPPAGHGPHRYFVSVEALDVATLDLPADSTPAFAEFNAVPHLLARATLVVTGEIPAA